jgi:hypothetical protein
MFRSLALRFIVWGDQSPQPVQEILIILAPMGTGPGSRNPGVGAAGVTVAAENAFALAFLDA